MEHTQHKRATLSLFCLLLFFTGLQSQNADQATADLGATLQEQQALQKKYSTQVKSYHQREIAPVMQATRAAFNQYISKSDQALIQRLKTEAASSENILGKLPKGREWRKANAARRAYAQSRKLNLADQELLENMTRNYMDQIDQHLAGLHHQKKNWDADVAALRSEILQSTPRKIAKISTDQVELYRRASFLLLDHPKVSAQDLARSVAVFPNPASTSQQLSFEVAYAGAVSVDLINMQGQVVKSLFDGTLDAGVHQLDVDLTEQTANQFIYRITDQNGVTAKTASRL